MLSDKELAELHQYYLITNITRTLSDQAYSLISEVDTLNTFLESKTHGFYKVWYRVYTEGISEYVKQTDDKLKLALDFCYHRLAQLVLGTLLYYPDVIKHINNTSDTELILYHRLSDTAHVSISGYIPLMPPGPESAVALLRKIIELETLALI